MRRWIWVLLLLALPARAETRMVAAAHPLAAAAGLAQLRAGGSAIDAAIATQAMLAVVEPQSSGLAGGAFLLHWDAAQRRLTSWDGRETAPAAATPDLFLREDGTPLPFHDAAVGGRAVGVPGVLRLLEAAHRGAGRRPWPALFADAIATAEAGFPVGRRLAAQIATEAPRLARDAAARELFLPGGMPLGEGAVLRNPALAATLRAIAAQGADALYHGPIADALVAAVRSGPNPGRITAADLAAYAPVARAPVCGRYRVYTVCGMGPPSSGGVAVLQILGVLAHQDMAALAPAAAPFPARAADAAFLLAEAGRLAFADRNRFLADADQVAVPLRGLLDPGYLVLRAQLVDRDRAITAPRAGNPPWATGPAAAPAPPQPENGTSHLSIVDERGDAVAMTTTIEDVFGARRMAAGMLLNNQLTDFSFLPEIDGRPVANRVAAAKRPRSSMAPTIVFDAGGQPVLVLGSAGGLRIIGHVAQTLVAVLDWGMDPQAAIALPRIGAADGWAELEEGTPAAELAPALAARGLPLRVRANTSGLHAIAIRRGPAGQRLLGGADPRRDGAALGE